jgi:hypothetical protein
MAQKLQELPKSEDTEFWGDGESIKVEPKPIKLCGHTKDNYENFDNYKMNDDGTISCTKCGWGFLRPGYIRVKDGKIVDLRFLTGVSNNQ